MRKHSAIPCVLAWLLRVIESAGSNSTCSVTECTDAQTTCSVTDYSKRDCGEIHLTHMTATYAPRLRLRLLLGVPADRARLLPILVISRVLLHAGYFSITSEECIAKGCCWAPRNSPGVPWCFHRVPARLVNYRLSNFARSRAHPNSSSQCLA